MHLNNHSIHVTEGVLIGTSLGLATGILFAPKSGKELRHNLAKKTEKSWRKMTHFYSDTQARADRILKDARKRAKVLRREADHQLRQAQAKAEEILGMS
jgi:gas vesicle protein